MAKRIATSGFLLASLLGAPAIAAAEPVAITVTRTGCEPAAVTVPSGRTVFRIRNDSQRSVEWEILKGVMVVEERENILPGFVQSLTATLDPGDYQMTCGLLSNPKGTLKAVEPGGGAASPGGDATPAQPAAAQ